MYSGIFGHPKIKLMSVILCYIPFDQSLHDHANILFAFGVNSDQTIATSNVSPSNIQVLSGSPL